MRKALLGLLLLTGCNSVEEIKPDIHPTAAHGSHDLHWTGTATIHRDAGNIDIGMDTRLQAVPLDHVYARSWLLKDGPSKSRAMIFEGSEGWIELDGKREPMTPTFYAHERVQFGSYEAIMLAQRLGPETVAAGKDRTRIPTPGGSGETELIFDKTGRLVELRNEVPDGVKEGVLIPQVFRYSGEIVDDGVRWPRRLEIYHGGKLYFSMDLTTFDAQQK